MSENEQHPEEERPASDQTSLTPPVAPSRERDPGAEDFGRNTLRTPSKEEVIDKLDRMPGLIAMGILPPAKANAMRSVYHTILSYLSDSPQSGDARVADADVLKILRTQPELLKVLQPFLTPEQLDLIIREAPK